ncbi:cilia- and flagella-associated protein 206 isoform X2 [Musca autumnalis]
MYDDCDGLQLWDGNREQLSVCKLQQFMQRCLCKCIDPTDITMHSLKMCYYSKNNLKMNLDHIKGKIEKCFKEKKKSLIEVILRYPENCNPKQLDELYMKMQVFIITNYFIGCPNDSKLLKQTRQTIDSVVGRGDLQKYVLKKKYHRLEYLNRLAATVCGILVFNLYNQQEGNTVSNANNVLNELEIAVRNTNDSLEQSLKITNEYIEQATHIIERAIYINIKEKTVTYRQPIGILRQVNKLVIFFSIHKRNLLRIKEMAQKNEYLIEVATKKFNCVMEKIHDILKFRSAIETELIFPHFVYLSEVWSSLILHLNCLMEVNKEKDNLETFIDENIKNHYQSLIDGTAQATYAIKQSFDYTLYGNLNMNITKQGIDLSKILPYLKDFCFLTIILTRGLFIPSRIQTKHNQHLKANLSFANAEYAKHSEDNITYLFQAFEGLILRSVDIILFLQLEEEIMKLEMSSTKEAESKQMSSFAQTEFHQGLTHQANNIYTNVSWNIWDYYRRTITLANLRQKQSTSVQTVVSLGKRNAQNQCHNTSNQ